MKTVILYLKKRAHKKNNKMKLCGCGEKEKKVRLMFIVIENGG